MAKPDNRSDNVEHLQQSINHTIENLEQSEQYLAEHADEISPQDREALQSKNERREQALNGFRSEIQDEAQHEANQ